MSKTLGNYMLVNHRLWLVHVHLIMGSYNFDGYSVFSMDQVRVVGCCPTKCSFGHSAFDVSRVELITIYLSSAFPFVLVNLLAGMCSLAFRGRGARVFWSNPLTQTYPAIIFGNFWANSVMSLAGEINYYIIPNVTDVISWEMLALIGPKFS